MQARWRDEMVQTAGFKTPAPLPLQWLAWPESESESQPVVPLAVWACVPVALHSVAVAGHWRACHYSGTTASGSRSGSGRSGLGAWRRQAGSVAGGLVFCVRLHSDI